MPRQQKPIKITTPEAPVNKHTFFTDDHMAHVRRKPLHKMSPSERTWATADTTAEFIRPINKFDVYNVKIKNVPVFKKAKKKKSKDKDLSLEHNEDSQQEEALNTSDKKTTQNEDNAKSKKKRKKQNQETDNNSDSTPPKASKKSKKKKSKETCDTDNNSKTPHTDCNDEELDLEEYGDIVNKLKNIICNTSEESNRIPGDNNGEEKQDESMDEEVIEVIDIAEDNESDDYDIEMIELSDDTGNENTVIDVAENYDLKPFSVKYNGNHMDYVFVNGFMVLKADGECLIKLRGFMVEKKISEQDYREAVELAISNGNKLIDSSKKIVCINCKQYGHYGFGCTYDPDEDDGSFINKSLLYDRKDIFSGSSKSMIKRKRFST